MQGIYLIHLQIYIKIGISSSLLLEIHQISQDLLDETSYKF